MKKQKFVLHQEAYNLGVQAYNEGKMRIPANDKNLHPLLNIPVGTGGINIINSWLKGWEDTHKVESDKELKRLGII